MPAQRVAGRIDDRFGRCLIRIADGEDDHVVTGFTAARRLHAYRPGAGASARDTVDKR